MTEQTQTKPEVVVDPEKVAMNKRFESIGWGFFSSLVSWDRMWKNFIFADSCSRAWPG